MTVIYLDILFLCNLTFDLLSVYITSHFAAAKLYPFRSLLGCVIGSLVGIWLLIWCGNGILFLVVAVFTLLFMVYLSFSPKSIGAVLRLSLVLLVCLFLSGAVAHYFLRLAVERFGTDSAIANDGKALLFSAISLLTGGLLSLSSKAWQKQARKKTVTACLGREGKTVKCTCLVDSGNLLSDPIDGRPVLLLPKSVAKELIESEDILFAMTAKDSYTAFAKLPVAYKSRMRIIPYRTINQKGILLCLLPHSLSIDSIEKNALFGICPLENGDSMGICPSALLS